MTILGTIKYFFQALSGFIGLRRDRELMRAGEAKEKAKTSSESIENARKANVAASRVGDDADKLREPDGFQRDK